MCKDILVSYVTMYLFKGECYKNKIAIVFSGFVLLGRDLVGGLKSTGEIYNIFKKIYS